MILYPKLIYLRPVSGNLNQAVNETLLDQFVVKDSVGWEIGLKIVFACLDRGKAGLKLPSFPPFLGCILTF